MAKPFLLVVPGRRSVRITSQQKSELFKLGAVRVIGVPPTTPCLELELAPSFIPQIENLFREWSATSGRERTRMSGGMLNRASVKLEPKTPYLSLRRERTSRGLKIREVAEALGKNSDWLAAVERNQILVSEDVASQIRAVVIGLEKLRNSSLQGQNPDVHDSKLRRPDPEQPDVLQKILDAVAK